MPSTLVLEECKGGDCGEGELCSNDVDEPGRASEGFCLSRRGAEATADRMGAVKIEENAVCVGVAHLQHLSSEELVYDRHRLARVLCDESGSCATPGHVVVYRGQPLMMRRYCDLVGCDSRIGYVNTLRYKRGVTVASRTTALVFTAFAARYGSRVEEKVLAVLVRAGL